MAFTAWHQHLDFSKYQPSESSTFPIIYVTGHTAYNGVLTNVNEASEAGVWNELIECKSIAKILISWQKRIQTEESSLKENETLSNIVPFRMVLHRSHRMKVAYGYDEDEGKVQKFHSRCHYFVLLWIPSNSNDGMNDNEYNELIAALNQNKYFCKKLNKECIYISGPKYGDEKDQQHRFNLDRLHSECKLFSNDSKNRLDIPSDKRLDIQIVVHEMEREKMDPTAFEFDVFRRGRTAPSFTKLPSISKSGGTLRRRKFSTPQRPPNISISPSEPINTARSGNCCPNLCPSSSFRRASTMGIKKEFEINVESIAKQETLDELDMNQVRSRDSHTFAFVWFKIEDKAPSNAKQYSYSKALLVPSRQLTLSKSATTNGLHDLIQPLCVKLYICCVTCVTYDDKQNE